MPPKSPKVKLQTHTFNCPNHGPFIRSRYALCPEYSTCPRCIHQLRCNCVTSSTAGTVDESDLPALQLRLEEMLDTEYTLADLDRVEEDMKTLASCMLTLLRRPVVGVDWGESPYIFGHHVPDPFNTSPVRTTCLLCGTTGDPAMMKNERCRQNRIPS